MLLPTEPRRLIDVPQDLWMMDQVESKSVRNNMHWSIMLKKLLASSRIVLIAIPCIVPVAIYHQYNIVSLAFVSFVVSVIACLALAQLLSSLQIDSLALRPGETNWPRISAIYLGSLLIPIGLTFFAFQEFRSWPISVVAFIGGLLLILLVQVLIAPDAEATIRGRHLLDFRTAKRLADRIRNPNDPGIWWAGLRIPTKDATTHFCVVGTTGSGKTVLMKRVMRDVLPRMAIEPDMRAIVYDPKQDILPFLHHLGFSIDQTGNGGRAAQVHIMNPFDLRAVAWEMAKDFTEPNTIENLANELVPEAHATRSREPYFPQASFHLVNGVLRSLNRVAPQKWQLRDVILCVNDSKLLRYLFSKEESTHWLIERYLDIPRTTQLNVLSSVSTSLGKFHTIAAAWHKRHRSISITRWLGDNSVLVLGEHHKASTPLRTINKLIMRAATDHMLSQQESFTPRHWIFLDEVRRMGDVDSLKELILEGRSKGCCVFLGFQDIEGMQDAFGDKRANEIVAQCNQLALLRLSGNAVARWASETIGTREFFQKSSYSTSTQSSRHGGGSANSTTWTRTDTALITASEFKEFQFPDENQILDGVFTANSIGVFKHRIPNIFSGVPRRDARSIEGHMPLGAEDQYLEPFDESDEERLGVPLHILRSQEPEVKAPPAPHTNRLNEIRRLKSSNSSKRKE